MPSKKYMDQYGVDRDDGVSMWMEHPFPGSGGRHRSTFTNGTSSGPAYDEYMFKTPRDALVQDIWNARNIYRQDGLYNSDTRDALQKVIDMNAGLYPELFKNR